MTDLEIALRDMLRERAGDITDLPPAVVPPVDEEVLDRGRPPGRRHATAWLVAAAVLGVLLVVASVLVVRRGTGEVRPGTPLRPTSPVYRFAERTACTASLPPAWRSAIETGTSRYDAVSAQPLAVSEDGRRMLVARDHGQARDVVLVAASGAARVIYSVPRPDENQVVNASLEGDYAVVDLGRLPHGANGVIPTVIAVLLIDLRDASSKVLDRVTEGQMSAKDGQTKTIDRSLLWDGHVYWDVRPRFAAPTSVIKDYSIADRRTTVAGHGGSGGPQLLADGVVWGDVGSYQVAIPRPVPSPVTAAHSAGARPLFTDGRSYAWVTADNRVAWWSPRSAKVVVVRPAGGVNPEVDGVAGPYVVLSDQSATATPGLSILDARTGALIEVPRGMGLQPYLLTAAGAVVSYRSFAGDTKESPTAVVRIDTTGLPELRC